MIELESCKMGVGPTWERKKIGRRIDPIPTASGGSVCQHDGFFSEIRFPIFSFPNEQRANPAQSRSLSESSGKRISEKNNRPNTHSAGLHQEVERKENTYADLRPQK
jgi:hypothetical protein